MSNNPYELRANLLKQAENILAHRHHAQLEEVRYLCDRDLVDPKTVAWPVPPSTEEIIDEACKLYNFVQTK